MGRMAGEWEEDGGGERGGHLWEEGECLVAEGVHFASSKHSDHVRWPAGQTELLTSTYNRRSAITYSATITLF